MSAVPDCTAGISHWWAYLFVGLWVGGSAATKAPWVIDMISNEPLVQLPISPAYGPAPVVALDAAFNTRWADWVARGRVHEQRARRRFVVGACVLSVGAAIVYTFLR